MKQLALVLLLSVVTFSQKYIAHDEGIGYFKKHNTHFMLPCTVYTANDTTLEVSYINTDTIRVNYADYVYAHSIVYDRIQQSGFFYYVKDNNIYTQEELDDAITKERINNINIPVTYKPYTTSNEGNYNKKNSGKTFLGFVQLSAGVLGTIITIVDANHTETIEVPTIDDRYNVKMETIDVENEWNKFHTITLSLSISSLIGGIITMVDANGN